MLPKSNMSTRFEARHDGYLSALRSVLPHIPNDISNIISAQVLIALKLNGMIGETLNPQDISMCEVLRDTILECPSKKQDALKLAQTLLN